MINKRDKITQTALRLFVKIGYENTPTSLISREAGVATGTLFHHFRTKEELINELFISSKQSIKQYLIAGLSVTNDIKEKLLIIWKNYIKWAVENPEQFEFLVKYSEHSAISQEAKSKVDNTYSELFGLIHAGSEQGVLAELPLEYLASLTQLHFSSAASYCIKHPEVLQKKKLQKRLFQSYWQSIS